MALTWGSMKTEAELDQACYEQAKREVNGDARTGLEWIRKTLHRAQTIKQEKRGENGTK